MFRSAIVLCACSALTATTAFQPAMMPRTKSPTQLNIVKEEMGVLEKIKQLITSEDYPAENSKFDALVKKTFPGAMSNKELQTKVVDILAKKGFESKNTLLCTSLCCDELARRLEDDLGKIYGKNFFLGGLAGFPFAGNTGFGAMSAHASDYRIL